MTDRHDKNSNAIPVDRTDQPVVADPPSPIVALSTSKALGEVSWIIGDGNLVSKSFGNPYSNRFVERVEITFSLGQELNGPGQGRP